MANMAIYHEIDNSLPPAIDSFTFSLIQGVNDVLDKASELPLPERLSLAEWHAGQAMGYCEFGEPNEFGKFTGFRGFRARTPHKEGWLVDSVSENNWAINHAPAPNAMVKLIREERDIRGGSIATIVRRPIPGRPLSDGFVSVNTIETNEHTFKRTLSVSASHRIVRHVLKSLRV